MRMILGIRKAALLFVLVGLMTPSAHADDYSDALRLMEMKGIAGADAAALIASVKNAAQAGLPQGPMLEKLNEGLEKGVGAPLIKRALEARYLMLEEAMALCIRARLNLGPERGAVVEAAARAMESGVPAQAVERVFRAGPESGANQFKAVLEAGESLQLAGAGPELVEAVMVDCLERKLKRSEILQAVRYARGGIGSGMDAESFRAGLWGRAGQGSGVGGRSGQGQGGPGGSGSGAGSGSTSMGGRQGGRR